MPDGTPGSLFVRGESMALGYNVGLGHVSRRLDEELVVEPGLRVAVEAVLVVNSVARGVATADSVF